MKKINKKIKISVGIPAYNEEANITNLIKNILAQKQEKYKLLEIIVISDGSTDNTVNKIKNIKNKKIKLFNESLRLGQCYRQNQIINEKSGKSGALLMFEADSIPADDQFINHMVTAIPAKSDYSYIVGNYRIVSGNNLFEKLVRFIWQYKNEIFEKAIDEINLYKAAGVRLFSKEFLKQFRWNSNFQEDSYCYRKAKESGMPIYSSKNAIIYYKSVSNIKDYFYQNGKFLKAIKKEANSGRQTYKLGLNLKSAINVSIKYFVRNPAFFFGYLLLTLASRVYSYYLPEYNKFWKIYKSSKVLKVAA